MAGSISSLVRVNRAEGLSLGSGVRVRVGAVADVAVLARYGFADRLPKGALRLTLRPSPDASISIGAFSERRDASDVAEASGIRNSIGAQEFGADFSEPYRVSGLDVRLERRFAPSAPVVASLAIAHERTGAAPVEAVPATGAYRAPLAVASGRGWRAAGDVSLAPRAAFGGALSVSATLQLRLLPDSAGRSMPARANMRAAYERSLGSGKVVAEVFGGLAGGTLPQDRVRAGGPVSGPGYAAHQFDSRALAWQRLEYQVPVSFPEIPTGRWGSAPGRATLAPLASIVVLEEHTGAGNRRVAGYPALGVGLLVFFDLVRVDLARGLRDGRWTFGIDLARDLWRIL